MPRAYVVKAKDTTLTEDDVKTLICQHCAPYKQLRGGVKFIESIPRSVSGKLLRKDLLASYLKGGG